MRRLLFLLLIFFVAAPVVDAFAGDDCAVQAGSAAQHEEEKSQDHAPCDCAFHHCCHASAYFRALPILSVRFAVVERFVPPSSADVSSPVLAGPFQPPRI